MLNQKLLSAGIEVKNSEMHQHPKKECKVFEIQMPVHHCNILSLAALLEGDLIRICCI